MGSKLISDSTITSDLLRRQRRDWETGQGPPVESYLHEHPSLLADPEQLLNLICHEIYLREHIGQQPQLDDYQARFPHFAEELKRQFEVHHVLEGLHQPSAAVSAGEESIRHPASGAPFHQISPPGYEILFELGRGGMGVVYRARQQALKRDVALKMILSGSQAGARERARFHIEAEAVARLQHANIVQIYEVNEWRGQPYVALELIDGESLGQYLAHTQPSIQEAARLTSTLAGAMHYAHQRGIIHRDLKPSNVLLNGVAGGGWRGTGGQIAGGDRLATSGNATGSPPTTRHPPLATHSPLATPKITDFGLAKLLDAVSDQTPTEALIGTPNYMAPEQAAGQTQRITPATDIYALGAILYELLTGQAPFRGANLLETLEQVRSQVPVAPTKRRPAVPRDLETICLKCLCKDPLNRYASAAQLANDLDRFRDGLPIRARPVSAGRRLRMWARRRPALAALIVVSVAAIVALIGLLGWHDLDLQVKTAKAQADERQAQQRVQHVIEQQRDEQQAHNEARQHYQQFKQRRNEALFHGVYGTQIAGADVSASLATARTAARDALEMVLGSTSDPPRNAYWTEREQAEVVQGCYELFLLFAELDLRSEPIRPAEALRCLDQAARIHAPTLVLHQYRVAALHALGDATAAALEQQRALQQQAVGAVDHFLLALEHFRNRRFPAAATELERALALQPGSFWARFYLAACHGEMNRPAEAVVALTACQADEPDFIWIYLLRGAALGKLNRFDEAEGDFAAAARLSPIAEPLYTLYLNRGVVRLERGRLNQARADLEKAAALEPGRLAPSRNLALLCRRADLSAEALSWLRKATNKATTPEAAAELHLERADVLYQLRRYRECLEASQQALTLDARPAAGYGLQAQACLAVEDYVGAVKHYSEYLNRGGKATADIFRGRGKAYQRLGNYQAAIEDYTRALQESSDAELFTYRGWSYFFCDAWKLALVDFDQALRRSPDSVEALTGRGLARVSLGNYRDAIADAEQALKLRPATPETFHNLACIFSLAIHLMLSDTTIANHDRLRAQYCRQAVGALNAGLQLLKPEARRSFWRTHMQPDLALDPIRASSEYTQLNEVLSR